MSDDPTPSSLTNTTVSSKDDLNRRSGGTSNASGVDFQAMAMVMAATHMIEGTRLNWLEKVASDVPVAITAETGGPGDDIGLELADGSLIEVQAKKGLRKGPELWSALEALVDGVASRKIAWGVLAITPDSSGTIKKQLAADVALLGQGKENGLSDIGREWLRRLITTNRPMAACANIRIQTLDLLEAEGSDRRLTITNLRTLCADPSHAEHAFNLIFRDAITLMRSRGRWTTQSIVRLLRSHDIRFRDDSTPAATIAKIVSWVEIKLGKFSLPGAKDTLPIKSTLPARLVATQRVEADAPDPSTALERYHAHETDAFAKDLFTGEWVGRFVRLNVVVAGPGAGKSTLADRIAWEHACDGRVVLRVQLKQIAAAMATGSTFETALWQHGLDGSGLQPSMLRYSDRTDLMVIGDGLDEVGRSHEEVAAALVAYAAGHPRNTIVITTRPIGYETGKLCNWRHYRLEPLAREEGARNLGHLLATCRGHPADDTKCAQDAMRELYATPAKDAITGNPLMLGMAAVLIARDIHLPKTKAAIYRSMIAMFETRDVEGLAAIPEQIANRILDILGWELTNNPLLEWSKLRAIACRILANDLGRTVLAVGAEFEGAFAHWERAGIVEKVHHGGIQLVTFVHKTFGEFAAARFLVGMGKNRNQEIERLIELPALGEVISFAGAVGLGNDLAQFYVDRHTSGVAGSFERALKLASDRETVVDDHKIAELVAIAFSIADTDANDRFSIGMALAELAKVKPKLVGPLAHSRLKEKNPNVRVIAWAAAVAADPDNYDTHQLDEALRNAIELVGHGRVTTTEMRLNRRGICVELIQAIALAALRSKSVEDMLKFVDERLSGELFDTLGFRSAVDRELVASGAKKALPFKPSGLFPSNAETIFFNACKASVTAANKVLAALANTVRSGTHLRPFFKRAPGYPEFSALYTLTGIGITEAADSFRWKDSYDQDAVAQTIWALVDISGLNRRRLAAEAEEIIARMNAAPNGTLHELGLGRPDIPELNWALCTSLQLDRKLIERAFHQGAHWLTLIAANMLFHLSFTSTDCANFLNRSQGIELYYAVQIIARHLDLTTWLDLLLARTENLPNEGIEHVLSALARKGTCLPTTTGNAVAANLRSEEAVVLAAAAELGLVWYKQGGEIDGDLVRTAYEGWYRREMENMGISMVTEARQRLLKLLIATNSANGDQIKEALSDADDELRAMAIAVRSRRPA